MRIPATIAFLIAASTPTFAQATIEWFLPPGATSIYIRTLSGDGRTFYALTDPGYRPVLCSDGNCRPFDGFIAGFSADGHIAIGRTENYTSLPFPRRWVDGEIGPSILPIGIEYGTGTCVSADGRVVAGQTIIGDWVGNAFIWTRQHGHQQLPAPPGGAFTWARAISHDGRVVVGTTYMPAVFDLYPTIWRDRVPSVITWPQASILRLTVWDVSDDGRVVLGLALAEGRTMAVRIAGGQASIVAVDAELAEMTADGWTIIGYQNATMGHGHSFIWNPVMGTRNFRGHLASLGAHIPAQWVRADPRTISPDGGTIAVSLMTANYRFTDVLAHIPKFCYANCDLSPASPALNILDFSCFLDKFAAAQSGNAAAAIYANCDNSSVPPVLNILDFNCFLNKFAQGCP